MTTVTDSDASPETTQDEPPAPRSSGLGAEVRESLMLLGFAVGVTVGLTTAAQAALALLS
jgi:hypothetical protein